MSMLNKFSKLMKEKKELLSCIFFTLATQILFTMLSVKVFDYTEHTTHILDLYKNSTLFSVLLFVSFIVSMLLIYALYMTNLSYEQKYVLFLIFSLIESFLLHIILSIYDENTIDIAIVLTGVLFSLLFVFGLVFVYFGYDLSWMGFFLYLSLFIIIICSIVFSFMPNHDSNQKILTIFSTIIFMLYIIYDTNEILMKSNQDCIKGAMAYYLDIINLFLDILKLINDYT